MDNPNNTLNVAQWKLFAEDQCRLEEPVVPWSLYDRLVTQESRWRQYEDDGSGVLVSYSGRAEGLGQLHILYYPESVRRDPFLNLVASVSTLRSNRRRLRAVHQSTPWRYAVAGYNWGMGHILGYTDKDGDVHLPWNGQGNWKCRWTKPGCDTAQMFDYLDSVLGIGWPEPEESKPVEPKGSVIVGPAFAVGEGLLNLMKMNGDTPATDELYFRNEAGVNQYSEAFGKSGARYVYVVSTNMNYRFPAG